MSSIEIMQVFLGLRYFSAVSFIAVVFDHLITVGEEVNTIWNNPIVPWRSKAAFMANRYVTEVILALVVYVYSGTGTGLSTTYLNSCRRFLWIYGTSSVVVGTISHFLIIIRVYGLWDHRKSVARILMGMFGVCVLTTSILGLFVVIQLQPELNYIETLQFHTCHFGTKPNIVSAMLAVSSLFDFAVVVLVIFNAMDRPRHTQVPIVPQLQKDGAGFFLTIFALRFADAVVSFFLDTPEIFLAYTTVWGFCTIINARLHMRLESLFLARAQGRVQMLEDSDLY